MFDLINPSEIKSQLIDIFTAFQAETPLPSFLDLKIYYLTKFHQQVHSPFVDHNTLPVTEYYPNTGFKNFLAWKYKEPSLEKESPEAYTEKYFPEFVPTSQIDFYNKRFTIALDNVCKIVPDFSESFALLISTVYLKKFQYIVGASEYNYPGYVMFTFSEKANKELILEQSIIHETIHQIIMLRECTNTIFTYAAAEAEIKAKGALTGRDVLFNSAYHSLFVGLHIIDYLIATDRKHLAQARLNSLEETFSQIEAIQASLTQPLLTDYGKYLYSQGFQKFKNQVKIIA